jgi:multidrug transporter EmrE-like cation transporter
MIQRIQTVYLFVSVVTIGIIAYLLQQQMQLMNGNFALAVLSALGVVFLLNLFTILLFKNRKLQSSLLLISLLIQLITVAGMAYGMLQLKYPILIPICVTSAVVICTVLARKGILADEKIVRSMDRLR